MRKRGRRFKEFRLKGISLPRKKTPPPTFARSNKPHGYTTLNNYLTKALPSYEEDMKEIARKSIDPELEHILSLKPLVFRPSSLHSKRSPPITLSSRHKPWRSYLNDLSSDFFVSEPIPRSNVPVPTTNKPSRSSPEKVPPRSFPEKIPPRSSPEKVPSRSSSAQVPSRSSPGKVPSIKTIASIFPLAKEKTPAHVAPKILIDTDADFGTVHDILSDIFPTPIAKEETPNLKPSWKSNLGNSSLDQPKIAKEETPNLKPSWKRHLGTSSLDQPKDTVPVKKDVQSTEDGDKTGKKTSVNRNTVIRNLHKARDQMKAKKMALKQKSPRKKTRPKIKKRTLPPPPPPPKPRLQKGVTCISISPSSTKNKASEMDIRNLVCSVSNKVLEAGCTFGKSTKEVRSRSPREYRAKRLRPCRTSPKKAKFTSVRCKLIISISVELSHRRLEYRKAVRSIVGRLRDLESKHEALVPGRAKKSRKKCTRGKVTANIGKGTKASQFHIRILEDLIHRLKLRMYFIAMRNVRDLSLTRADLVKKVCRREHVILLRLAFETWNSLARHRIKKKESAKKMWKQKQSELVHLVMFHWKTLLGPIKERRLGEDALRKWLARRRQRYYFDAWMAVFAIRKFNKNLEIVSIKYNVTRHFQRWRVRAARQCFLRYRLCEAQGRPMERSTLLKYLADACVEFKLKLRKPVDWQNWRDRLREQRYGQEKHRYALRKWRDALLIIPPDGDAQISLEELATNLFKKRLITRSMKAWRLLIRGERLRKATARILKRIAFRKTREFATFQRLRSQKCTEKARHFQLGHRFRNWRWLTRRLGELRDDVLLDVYPCAQKTRYFRRWRKWLVRIHALEGMADIVIKQQRIHGLCEHFFRLKGIYLWRKHDRALTEQLEKQEDLVTRLYIQRKHFDTWNIRVKSGKRMKIRNIHKHMANVKCAISIKQRFMEHWIKQYNLRKFPLTYARSPRDYGENKVSVCLSPEHTTKLLMRDQTTSPDRLYGQPQVKVLLNKPYSPVLRVSGRNLTQDYTEDSKLRMSSKNFTQSYEGELLKEPITPMNNLLRNVLDYKLLRPTKQDILDSFYGCHPPLVEMVETVIVKSPTFSVIVKSPRPVSQKKFHYERRSNRKSLELENLKFTNSWDSLLRAPFKVRRRRSRKLQTKSETRPKIRRRVLKKRPKVKRTKTLYKERSGKKQRPRIVKQKKKRISRKTWRKKKRL